MRHRWALDRIEAVKPPIRLLAVDIDGTLLDSEFKVPAANISALQRAHQAGIEIVLVTGRRHIFALPIAQVLGFDLWLISSNGAVTKSLKGELFHRDLLPASMARRLIRHMDAFRGNAVLTFDHDEKGALVLERTDELTLSIQRWLQNNQPYIDYVVPLENALTSDPIQLMFCGSIARMQQAEERLQKAGMEREITVLKTEYVHRDLCLYDVLNYGCSKGHAVERWALNRGISREQVMAIGDNYNDVTMLAFAGTPVIMGNACEQLKNSGWMVTLSNDQAGVAAALEQTLGI